MNNCVAVWGGEQAVGRISRRLTAHQPWPTVSDRGVVHRCGRGIEYKPSGVNGPTAPAEVFIYAA